MDSSKTLDELREQLNEASNSHKLILQHTHNEALVQNELQTKRWQDYKVEHEELSARLLFLRDKLSHQIMVPVGKKALLRGTLVHTNEILVCLGGGWFAKQSANQAAGICQRRIKHCDEMLKNLQKENELLMSRKSFAFESEAFNADQTQEIIEPYDEEAEKQWRENHAKKQKEYHQKLAELKKNQKTKIETEEDLWSRLDALDLQEEIEDELNRLNDDEEDDFEESEDEDSTSDTNKESDAEHSDKKTQSVKNIGLKRRVSFKEEKENDDTDKHKDSDTNDDMIHILFKHSKAPSSIALDPGDEITNPADIYTHYVRQRMPKSILKPSSSGDTISKSEATENSVYCKHVEEAEVSSYVPTEPVTQAVGEVVEHTPSTSTAQTSQSTRSVSRFRAARKANKR